MRVFFNTKGCSSINEHQTMDFLMLNNTFILKFYVYKFTQAFGLYLSLSSGTKS